jgi:REP-associated tyrosine transposase
VRRAEDWPWGSLRWRTGAASPLALAPAPIELPSYWTEFVNQPQTAAELAAIRDCVNKQMPCGDPDWVQQRNEAAARLGTKR